MRILFDHGTPAPLIPFPEGHAVTKAKQAGWDRLVNGEFLNAAEATGFELLVTPDKNVRYQQNLEGRQIAIIVLGNAQWPVLRRYVDRVVVAVNAATPGNFAEVEIPYVQAASVFSAPPMRTIAWYVGSPS
jgi:hypothetical protein